MKYLFTLLLLISLLPVFGQEQLPPGKWKIFSHKNDGRVQITTGNDSALLNQITLNGLKQHINVLKGLRFTSKQHGLLDIDLRLSQTLSGGDSCVFFLVGFQNKIRTIYLSKPVSGTSISYLHSFSLEKGIDSLVIGFSVNGTGNIKIAQLKAMLISGNALHVYKQNKAAFVNNSSNIANLALIGKVWGLLKYYYPTSIYKDLDWDEQLMASLSALQHFDRPLDLNKTLAKLLQVVQAPSNGKMPHLTPYQLQIVNNHAINDQNRRKIIDALCSASMGASRYYKAPDDDSPAPHFIESNPDVNAVPDPRARLVQIFRYWNIINYFYPYKDEQLPNWDQTLNALLPQFLLADTEPAYTRALLKLNASIADGHAWVPMGPFIMAERLYGSVFSFLPIDIRINKDGKALVADAEPGFAQSSGIKKGDQLIKIGGINIDSLIDELKAYISESDPILKNHYLERSCWLNMLPTAFTNQLTMIYSSQDKVVDTTFSQSQENLAKSVSYVWQHYQNKNTLPPAGEALKYYREKHTLFINPAAWKANMRDSALRLINIADNLIIDCRTYPDWNFVADFSECLLRDNVPVIEYTTATDTPEYFAKQVINSAKDGTCINKKIYCLISEDSKSRPEFLATKLKSAAPDCLLVGRRTAGADGDITSIPTVGKQLYLTITSVGVKFADGTKTQQVGLQPDIMVGYAPCENCDAILDATLKRIQ